jgi:arylsulfatase A-like enzyme
LICGVSLAIAAVPTDRNARRTATMPNIILIVADDLGYGDLGSYGQNEIKTLNLDRPRRRGNPIHPGLRGKHACAPSRCSLLTGMPFRTQPHPQQRPGAAGADRLHPRRSGRSVPGIGTAAIGKWALGWEGSTASEPSRIR